jgi:sortase family protein
VLRWLPGTLILASITAGIVLAVAGQHTLRWSPPPVPPRTMARPAASRAAPRATAPPARSHRAALPRPMTRSRPVSLAIPAIQLRARIIPLGQAPDGAPAVPSLGTPLLTSWYDRGPTPGAAGTAIIFGHVDAATTGPAVFYNLGRLRRGDLVYVTLADRRTGLFRVYAAELYAKSAFPPAIYGPTWWPTLRLITCGGRFDPATGHYLANTVVFAEYVGQRG